MKSAISILVISLAVFSTGCGNSSARMLESVTATPASADAQKFPNGTVQFTPTGIFNKAPTRVTPLPSCSASGATGSCITAWSTSPSTIASIDQNGLAQCVPSQSGTATIQVAVSGDGPLMGDIRVRGARKPWSQNGRAPNSDLVEAPLLFPVRQGSLLRYLSSQLLDHLRQLS